MAANDEHVKVLLSIATAMGWHPSTAEGQAISAAIHAISAQAAELAELREHNRQLTGERFSERNHGALRSRAEVAEREADALRQKMEEWARQAERVAHTHHRCDATNVCDALAQSMTAALAARQEPTP